MTKRMVNKHRMFIAVLDFLLANSAKLTFAPALAGYVTALQATLAEMSNLEQAQLASSKGLTQTKASLKEQAVTLLLDIINRAKAYSIVTENLILKDAVNYTYSQLINLPQDSFLSVANKVITICAGNVTEMTPYGLTQPMLDSVPSMLDEYAATLPGTKRIIAARKTATGELAASYAEADDQLKKIDAMMEIISASDPAFYKEYKNLRVIVDLKGKAKANGNGSMGITGTASSLETGLNQPGVTVSVVGTNLSALTDAEGNYTLPITEAGSYSLKAVLAGYNDYTEDDIEVLPGELTEVDFDMEPAI